MSPPPPPEHGSHLSLRRAVLAAGSARGCHLMLALCELLDDLVAERRQIVRLARGHQALVDHYLLVDPFAAGVADVGLQARVRGERAAPHQVGLDQRPGAMADDADRLARTE